MVFLYNALPYLIVIVFGLTIRYLVPSKVGKIIIGVIGVLALLVYFQVQPSYMPKGEVRKNDVVFDYAVKELRESRLRKPVDVEVWDAKMEEARTKIEEAHKNAQIRLGEVRQQIKEIKDKE